MQKIFFPLITLFLSLQAAAQQPSTSISGSIRDLQNEALPSATVRLLKAGDSMPVRSQVTSDAGRFHFAGVPSGSFVLSVTAVGKKPFTGLSFRVDSLHRMILLPAIVMQAAKQATLATVNVTAKRPLVEQEIDKTIINVGSMISSASSSTLEVLEKTPGVVVNANGDISLNGRNGVLVMIEGRSTYLSGQDLTAYLRSLPGSMIEKIELMDNPSSRYDAAGNAIINIRMKRNRAAGYTGSLALGYNQGRYGRSNDAVNINYNRRKINLFANAGYNRDRGYTEEASTRSFYNTNDGLISTVLLDNWQRSSGKSINANAGIDYQANASTTYGFQLNLNSNRRDALLDFNSNQFAPGARTDTMAAGNSAGKDNRMNLGSNLNFLHKFGKSGRELSADLNYLHYANDGLQYSENRLLWPDGSPQNLSAFLYKLPSEISIFTFKADYVHPMKNRVRLEAGLKSGIVDNDHVADYYNKLADRFSMNDGMSNHFRYREMINAVYVNGQKSWKRLGVQLGLRIENTHASGTQLGNQSVPSSRFIKDYTRFFPGIFVNYKLDSAGKNGLALSITRRINRPGYQQLNPFVIFRDKYSYTAGNPMLGPQYQYRYELRFTHRQWFRTTLSYNRFTDVIFPTTKAVGDVFIATPQNIAKGYMLLLNNGINLNPTKWWNLNVEALLSFIGLNGLAYTEALTPSTFVARINVMNQHRFGKSWSAEWGGYFASQDLNGQAFTGGMIRANAGIQKKIWKEKGSVRISADDIFHSWIYHNRSVSLKQSRYYQVSESDTRRIGIAFTYRFGKEDFARKRRHNNNAADDEKGRVE